MGVKVKSKGEVSVGDKEKWVVCGGGVRGWGIGEGVCEMWYGNGVRVGLKRGL